MFPWRTGSSWRTWTPPRIMSGCRGTGSGMMSHRLRSASPSWSMSRACRRRLSAEFSPVLTKTRIPDILRKDTGLGHAVLLNDVFAGGGFSKTIGAPLKFIGKCRACAPGGCVPPGCFRQTDPSLPYCLSSGPRHGICSYPAARRMLPRPLHVTHNAAGQGVPLQPRLPGVPVLNGIRPSSVVCLLLIENAAK